MFSYSISIAFIIFFLPIFVFGLLSRFEDLKDEEESMQIHGEAIACSQLFQHVGQLKTYRTFSVAQSKNAEKQKAMCRAMQVGTAKSLDAEMAARFEANFEFCRLFSAFSSNHS